MWKKKLKYKKVQFLLIGVMLLVIAGVLCTCIGFSLELKTYAKHRFSKESCPDAYVYAVGNINPKEHFEEEQIWSNIKDVHCLGGKNVSIPILHDQSNISSITDMMCTLTDDQFKNFMERVEGDLLSAKPGDYEVWIPKTMATSYHINVGDHLIMNYDTKVDLVVTCIYTATFAPSERLTIMANIVNEKTLQSFDSEEDAGILAVNLNDCSKEKVVELAMHDNYSLITFDRKSLSDYTTQISSIVGIVSAVAAFIVFLAALFIIRFIINNDIRKELCSIGIYKSLGYPLNAIIGFYLKAYLVVGSCAVFLGSMGALPVISYLASSTTKSLGKFELSKTSIFLVIGTSILLIAMLGLCDYLVLKKVKKISPVEAITVGHKSGEDKMRKSVIPSAKSPFTTQINEIMKHKKTSFVTLLVLVVSMYLILFFASSYCACTNVYTNANIWLACPKFNCIVTGDVDDHVVDAIEKSSYVNHAISGTCFYYPAVTIKGYQGNSRMINFYVFSNTEEEVTKVHFSDGRNPKRTDEIALTSHLLHKLNKSIGDYVQIEMGELNQQFLICGKFESMESDTVMLTIDAMKTINPEYQSRNCYIQLERNEDFSKFKAEIEQQFLAVSVDSEWTALRSAVNAIETMLSSVMAVMLIVFVIFVLIAIINVLVLTLGSKHRQYGILKSLGFTTKYIIEQNLCHIVILLGVASIIAVTLHFLLSRMLFSAIVIDAVRYTASLPYLCLFGCVLLIMIVTVLFSLSIKKITPVSLMEE